jgi:dUTP pyrophosphatase
MFEEEEIKAKILDILDEKSPYTQEDFDNEFNVKTMNIAPMEKYMINFNFSNKSTNPDPEYATDGSSGFDLRANIEDQPIIIKAGKVGVIPTGLFFEIPTNFEIQVRPRSGLAAKNGVTVLNTPGTVDADYRGEVKVILINHGEEDFVINHGDRIAQAVASTVTAKNIIRLSKISDVSTDTERGEGGFGSTGLV